MFLGKVGRKNVFIFEDVVQDKTSMKQGNLDEGPRTTLLLTVLWDPLLPWVTWWRAIHGTARCVMCV